ncbi:hypothetical protein VNO80_06589 [Phaseolus coccineus]|uniref:Uncharacterized protein n=1 Tax=Phaseolus coccineus TaxID=3886 RepID=A0AAN9RHR4_PHACN
MESLEPSSFSSDSPSQNRPPPPPPIKSKYGFVPRLDHTSNLVPHLNSLWHVSMRGHHVKGMGVVSKAVESSTRIKELEDRVQVELEETKAREEGLKTTNIDLVESSLLGSRLTLSSSKCRGVVSTSFSWISRSLEVLLGVGVGRRMSSKLQAS